jgi:hypothetical protein
MSFTSINLTEPVLAKDLAAYGAKPGQHDFFPDGIVVFAKNSSGSTINAGTVYISAAGALSGSSAVGSLTGKTLAACPDGAGIYAIVQGIVPGTTPAFVPYTVVSE